MLCPCLRACEYRTDSHQLFFFPPPRGKEVESVSFLFVSVCLCVFFFFLKRHIFIIYIIIYYFLRQTSLLFSLCACVCVSFSCCSYCFLTSDCSLLSPLPRCLDEAEKKKNCVLLLLFLWVSLSHTSLAEACTCFSSP